MGNISYAKVAESITKMGITTVLSLQVVASQDWPEVTKYAGLVCAQAHRQELIGDLYKEWKDPQGGKASGGMIPYVYSSIESFIVFLQLSVFGSLFARDF